MITNLLARISSRFTNFLNDFMNIIDQDLKEDIINSELLKFNGF